MIAGRLEVEMVANIARLQKDVQDAKGVLSGWARDVDRTLSSVKGMFAAFGAGLSVGALVAFTKNAIDAADELEKMSQKTGIAVTELSKLQYAAELSGVNAGALGTAMKTLSQRMTEATVAGSKAGKIFAALGVDAQSGTLPAMTKLADAFAAMPDGATKTAAAVELFGKAGMDLIPMLNQGAAGIRATMEEAQRLGIVMNEEAAKSAEQFNDNMRAVKASGDALAVTLANQLLPSLTEISRAMKQAAEDGGLLMALWVGLGGVAHSVGEKLGLIKTPLQKLQDELDRLSKMEKQGPGLLERVLGLDQTGNIQVRMREIERQIRALTNIAPGASPGGAAAPSPGGGSAVTSVLGRILGGGKEDEEAARAAKRLRDEDARGWIAYIDAITAEYEDGLKAQSKALDEWRANEKRMREISDAEWVRKIDAEVAEYERGLREMASQQPSHIQAMEAQWIAMWDQVSDVAGSFFSDLVMNGKSAFDNLKRFVKQLLAEMIALFAKRWILQMTGNGSLAAQTGQGTLSGLGSDLMSTGLSMAGNYVATAAGFTGLGTVGGFTGAMTGAIPAAAIGADAVAAGVGVNTVATSLGSSLSGVYSALAAIPVWGWIAMAVIAIGAWIAGNHKGGPKVGGSFFSGGAVPGTDNGRFFTPDQGDSVVRDAVLAGIASYESFTRGAFGVAPGRFNFGLGFDHDPAGTAQSRVSSMLTDAQGNILYQNLDRSMDDKEVEGAMALEMKRMFLAALQATDISEEVDAIFDAVGDITQLSAEQIDALIAKGLEMNRVVRGLESLGLTGLNAETLKNFALYGESIGQTFDRVAATWTAFEDSFLSDAQKIENAQAVVTSAFASLGIAIPESKQAFYDLVKGLDLSTEAGRQMFTALMAVAPAFDAVSAAASQTMSEFDSLMGRLRPGYTAGLQGSQLSSSIAAFQAANPWAAGMSQSAFLEQLRTITREDFASYSASNQQLILSILGLDDTINNNTAAVQLQSYNLAQYGIGGTNESAGAGLNAWAAGRGARANIADYLNGLLTGNTSPLDPMGQFNAAQSQYQSVLAAAQGGDVDAMMKLPGVHKTMIELARSIWGSSSTFVQLFERTFSEVAGVGEVPDYQTRMLAISTDSLQYQAEMSSTLTDIHAVLMEIRDRPTAAATADSWSER